MPYSYFTHKIGQECISQPGSKACLHTKNDLTLHKEGYSECTIVVKLHFIKSAADNTTRIIRIMEFLATWGEMGVQEKRVPEMAT